MLRLPLHGRKTALNAFPKRPLAPIRMRICNASVQANACEAEAKPTPVRKGQAIRAQAEKRNTSQDMCYLQ